MGPSNLQTFESDRVISIIKNILKYFPPKKIPPTKMTQKPLTTRTTKAEELEYIWTTLKEIVKILTTPLSRAKIQKENDNPTKS